MVINATLIFIFSKLSGRVGRRGGRREVSCAHLQCRLESRRARVCGSADLQVGMVNNATLIFIFSKLSGRVGRRGGRREVSCAHLRCRLESRRARVCGSADLQVGMVINATLIFIFSKLSGRVGRRGGRREVSCAHLQCRVGSRRAHTPRGAVGKGGVCGGR